MKSMNLLVLPLLALLYGLLATAQSVDSTQVNLDKKMVKAITNSSGEVVFVFHDGREAQVFYGPNASATGQVKLQQVENTCGYQLKPASCVVEGYYQNIKFQLEWTKHSDSKKVGQVVERINSTSSQPPEKVQSNDFLTDITYEKILTDKPTNFPRYKLKCDQSEWIQNINDSPNKVIFSSIAAEFMIENFETRVNENLTSAEIYNVQFDKIAENTYELSSYQNSSSMFTSLDPFFSNQVIHFVYEKNNQVCHVAFAANAADIINKVGEMQEADHEIKNKKLLRQVGNFNNIEISFSIQDLLRVEKDDANTRYQ